ncbi:HEAT repeat domain-containing protein [Actinomadura craniellae]|uniref:HEAT repeat domain-containing protein n=1 Tax=Actinomadura craniellae TaxID=2231787 RepID=A0A365H9T1_9ACTN|nr:HEAT repeat domain-containing protein [Actinomadura craniellae]RAY15900.1 HEAT repeat domain-containing protein [Actinomadura craniellae]
MGTDDLPHSDDPAERLRALIRLDERITESGPGPELAALLPASPAGLPPEGALLLARLHERLRAHTGPPRWDPAGWPARVRIAWRRAEVLARPEILREPPADGPPHQAGHHHGMGGERPPDETLYQAVHSIEAADADDPDLLIGELIRGADPVLCAAALRLTREALHQGLLSPARARAHLAGLAGSAAPQVAEGAQRELAEPWAALDPLPESGLPDGPAIAEVAARHGHPGPLWEVAADPDRPPRLRRRALELLGGLATRADAPRLVRLAATDPLLLGGPLFGCLGEMHRRGHFAGDDQVPALLGLALADHTIPAETSATVLFTCRDAMLRTLAAAPTDAPDWPRRLDLLVALAGQGTGDPDIGDTITRMLAEAGDPRPFLRAVRALRHRPAEDAVLAALPLAAGAALDALEAVGGPRTAAMLRDGLDGEVAPYLRPVRHRALELLWLLTEDTGERGRLLDRLDPRDLPARIAADLGGPDERELAVLRAALDPDRPVDALCRLARHGTAGTVPALTDLLLRVVSDLAAGAAISGQPAGRHSLHPGAQPGSEHSAQHSGRHGVQPGDRHSNGHSGPLGSGHGGGHSPQPGGQPGSGYSGQHSDRHGIQPGDRHGGGHGVQPGSGHRGQHSDRHGVQPGGGHDGGHLGGVGDAEDRARRRKAGVAEPAVPAEVIDAVCGLGARLYRRGRIRPVCLLDAGTAEEAGRALVATMALDLLERPDLADAERAILLELLGRVPHPATRARVHRLLRHRDPQVRKHVIALLAGPDARALSASLLPLTASGDARTVRQALLALGNANARWASPAIAAALDHPTMNIKKTAAAALGTAGDPAAVPKLLYWLGRHDNPGLRDSLTAALRAILGTAYPATVLAAAERADGDRTRTLLLEGLHRTLSARAVGALADQGSPAGPALLELLANGRIALGSGALDDLATYGVTPRDQTPRPDADAALLAEHGWDAAAARRLLDRPTGDLADRSADHPADRSADHSANDPASDLADRHLAGLRPLLDRWLELVEADRARREPALRLVLRLCPAPWTDGEVEAFARSAPLLAGALARASGAYRDGLLSVLDAAVPRLPAESAFDLAGRLRALPGPVPLGLLRRCGAVLTRADVERALAAARTGPDPWRVERRVLHDAFGLADSGPDSTAPHHPGPEERSRPAVSADSWRTDLETAARTPRGLQEFRSRNGTHRGTGPAARGSACGTAPDGTHAPASGSAGTTARDGVHAAAPGGAHGSTGAHGDGRADPRGGDSRGEVPGARGERAVGSREKLAALAEVYPHAAGPEIRAALLDWMVELQPVDAPAWTLAEEARRPVQAERVPRAGDLDQPRSAALRDRLLALLGGPDADRRQLAARALRGWPEPEVRAAVLRAHLAGRVDVPVTAELARALPALDPAELGEGTRAAEVAALLIEKAGADADLGPVARLLPEWWRRGVPAAGRALRRMPADMLADLLADRLAAREWGFLDLLADRPVLNTPPLAEARRRSGDERLVLVDGPLRPPGAAREDTAALAALRARPDLPEAASRPSRRELLELARTGPPEQARRALSSLAEQPADEELAELLAELLGHPEHRVRLHAHRISRRVLDRPAHLRLTELLLDDPRPDVVRSAVNTLCHAGWEPALPAVADLLLHPDPTVRRAAADGLVLVGGPAVPALRHAAGRARPDRRPRYTAVLDRITAG